MKKHRLDIDELKVQSFFVSDFDAASYPPDASGYPWCTVAGECGSFFICGGLGLAEGAGPDTVG